MDPTAQTTIILCSYSLLYSAASEANSCDFSMTRSEKTHFALLYVSCSFVHHCELRIKLISAAATPKQQKRTLSCTEVNDFAKSKAAENVALSLVQCAKIKP